MQRITTFLWFNDNAEEAVNFYISIFKNSKIQEISRIAEGRPGKTGTVLVVKFQLEGQEFLALNGGPQFKFTEAISLFVNCSMQSEIDELWEKLSEGGEKVECGWLKDKYGLSWQIAPEMVISMLSDPDTEKSNRVMQAVMKMKKLDIAKLKAAYEGR